MIGFLHSIVWVYTLRTLEFNHWSRKRKRKFEFEIALWVILSSLWEGAWLLIRILHDNFVCFICLVRILVCIHWVERAFRNLFGYLVYTQFALFVSIFLVSKQWQQNNNGFEKDKLGYRVSNEQFVPLSIRYDTWMTGKTIFSGATVFATRLRCGLAFYNGS